MRQSVAEVPSLRQRRNEVAVERYGRSKAAIQSGRRVKALIGLSGGAMSRADTHGPEDGLSWRASIREQAAPAADAWCRAPFASIRPERRGRFLESC